MEEKKTDTLLIVDDVPVNLKLLFTYLREYDFKVRVAEDGEHALKEVADAKPDLILLDVMMPKMDGFETCRRLKADENSRDIPVIFMTALGDLVDKVKGFDIGAVDYITKPIHHEEVLARINTHVTLRRQKRIIEKHSLALKRGNVVLEEKNLELQQKNTEIERQAELLRESERKLEQRVHEKTRELALAHDRLKVLDKAKSDFLKLICHELHTPLHGLLGTVECLFEDKLDEAGRREFAAMFRQSYDKLDEIIQQSLLLTEIEVSAASFLPESNPLDAIMVAAYESASVYARPRGISFGNMPDCDIYVTSDADLLVKALTALFKTAVKLSENGGVVDINCALTGDDAAIGIHTAGPA
ncbi:MAG: response regulator, partial [Gammaproteobacteria bacterium]|nr:response regulator [Gammaproteobacteria bacterium]